ncbi:(2Fe-2S)-binding protein [Streptomyces sp. NPDC048415]|jgi:NAD(P)H-nitrite reductase large subunit|uniref:(2Fe-2S)-binding protein n=1 Tax=Streptomyces sp. NPDC048415 TaxID=3154822 RepID=UPI00343C4240
MTSPCDLLVCLCSRVSEGELIEAIHAGHQDVAALREATGANTGCGDCLEDLEDLLAHEAEGNGSEEGGPQKPALHHPEGGPL